MSVTEIRRIEQYRSVTRSSVPSIVRFKAHFSNFCHEIEPYYKHLASRNPRVKFYDLEIFELEDHIEEMGVLHAPTFFLFINGKKVDSFTTGHTGLLDQMVAKANKASRIF